MFLFVICLSFFVCCLFVVCLWFVCDVFVVCCLLFVFCWLLFVAYCLPIVVCRLLLASCCVLCVVRRASYVVCCVLCAVCRALCVACCRRFLLFCRLSLSLLLLLFLSWVCAFVFVTGDSALRVPPAETRLTVYRRFAIFSAFTESWQALRARGC